MPQASSTKARRPTLKQSSFLSRLEIDSQFLLALSLNFSSLIRDPYINIIHLNIAL